MREGRRLERGEVTLGGSRPQRGALIVPCLSRDCTPSPLPPPPNFLSVLDDNCDCNRLGKPFTQKYDFVFANALFNFSL